MRSSRCKNGETCRELGNEVKCLLSLCWDPLSGLSLCCCGWEGLIHSTNQGCLTFLLPLHLSASLDILPLSNSAVTPLRCLLRCPPRAVSGMPRNAPTSAGASAARWCLLSAQLYWLLALVCSLRIWGDCIQSMS